VSGKPGKSYNCAMRAAALQFDVTSSHDQNLEFVSKQLDEASERGIELVLLPEMWASSFPTSGEELAERAKADQQSMDTLRTLSAELNLCIGGSALYRLEDSYRNRFQVFEQGSEVLYYDKVHLFSPTAEHEVFHAGEDASSTVKGAGAELAAAICYDLRFPEQFRVAQRSGVEVFLLSAQWPKPRDAHWRALVIARAIETQCFIVACNRLGNAEIGRRRLQLEFPGNSLIVSPHGEVLAEGQGQAGLVEADLDISEVRRFRTRVPVLRDSRADLYQRWLEDCGTEPS
jgi:omega-amidase